MRDRAAPKASSAPPRSNQGKRVSVAQTAISSRRKVSTVTPSARISSRTRSTVERPLYRSRQGFNAVTMAAASRVLTYSCSVR